MSNIEKQAQLIQNLTQEQIDAVAGGTGEILPRYITRKPEDTKGGGDPAKVVL